MVKTMDGIKIDLTGNDENQFREVLEQLSAPAWVIRENGSIVYTNPEAARLYSRQSNRQPGGKFPTAALLGNGEIQIPLADGSNLVCPAWSTASRWGGEPALLVVMLGPFRDDEADNQASQPERDSNSRVNQLYSILDMYVKLLQDLKNPAEVLTAVKEFAQRLFGSQGGVLYTTNPDTAMLMPAVSWGNFPDRAGLIDPGNCTAICGRSQQYYDQQNLCYSCGMNTSNEGKHLLCTPLVAAGEIQGLLLLHGTAENLLFGGIQLDHLKLVANIFASQTAGAIVHAAKPGGNSKLHDQMKGMFNGVYADDLLDMEIHRAARHNRPFSVMLVQVNINYPGEKHLEASKLEAALGKAAQFLRSQIRFEDLAFRYSARQFILVLLEAKPEDAMVRAEVMRMGAKNIRFIEKDTLVKPVSISIGVSGFPVHGGDVGSIIKAANTALDEAESKGGDRVCLAK
jgi:diguanylate cyclase (GGDEF)-like protein